MPTPEEPTRRYRGECPTCGSKNLRRIKEGENEFVLTQRRECRDCGTVFTPPLPVLLAIPVFLIVAVAAAAAVWGLTDPKADHAVGIEVTCVTGGIAVFLSYVGVQLIRHRTPRVHQRPKPAGPRPWEKKPPG